MAYAAEIDANGVVINVIVIPDSVTDRQLARYCRPHGAPTSTWRRTSKERDPTRNPGKNYAGKGMVYDDARSGFRHERPKDFEGRDMQAATLDDATCRWSPPPLPDGWEARLEGTEYAPLWSDRLGEWVIVDAGGAIVYRQSDIEARI